MIRLSINPDALGGGSRGGATCVALTANDFCQPANSGHTMLQGAIKKGIRKLTAQEEQSD